MGKVKYPDGPEHGSFGKVAAEARKTPLFVQYTIELKRGVPRLTFKSAIAPVTTTKGGREFFLFAISDSADPKDECSEIVLVDVESVVYITQRPVEPNAKAKSGV